MRKKIGHERLVVAGACVIVRRGRLLLLQKRLDNGCWALHGGCCEPGETMEETARRELLEETGLTAGRLELLQVFSGKELFYTYPNGDKVANVCAAYVCADFTGALRERTDETADLRWFDLAALPEDIFSPPTGLCCGLFSQSGENEIPERKRQPGSLHGAKRGCCKINLQHPLWNTPEITARPAGCGKHRAARPA
jgi:8-oxo-dGTP pyrophosphatase MutT (NUDIX family)